MANTDRTRKLLVRSALVTSSTIVTLVGAQNLAMLDARSFQPAQTSPTGTANSVVIVTPEATRTPVTVERAAPSIMIMRAAPSITILRQSGQVTAAAAQPVSPQVASTANIQPPAPSQISAPRPVVVQQQQPAPQSSRSSR